MGPGPPWSPVCAKVGVVPFLPGLPGWTCMATLACVCAKVKIQIMRKLRGSTFLHPTTTANHQCVCVCVCVKDV